MEKQKNRERTGQNVVKLDLVSQGRSGVRCGGRGKMLGGWVQSSGWEWGHSKAYLRQANNYVYM